MEKNLKSGWECMRRGEFFDTHEFWEIEWKKMSGRRRVFWQALIQLSVGCYHYQNNNMTGCVNLWRKALKRCNGLLATHSEGRETLVAELRDVLCKALNAVDAKDDPLVFVEELAHGTFPERSYRFD
jgi:predicted metal-dependent hydrolase